MGHFIDTYGPSPVTGGPKADQIAGPVNRSGVKSQMSRRDRDVAASFPGGLSMSTTEQSVPRTVLEYLLQQRDRTHEEVSTEFAAVASSIGDDATLSPRHLRRLASGERKTAGPQTRRVLQEMFGYPFSVLMRTWDAEAQAEYAGHIYATAPGVARQEVTRAIHRTFIRVASSPGSVPLMDDIEKPLGDEVITAWQFRQQRCTEKPHLAVIGGYAGCGKSEFAKFLSSITGWALLDKDTLTRPLVEALLQCMDSQPNDRESEAYLQKVRPLEYQCLMTSAYENIECGISTILAAPFIAELNDKEWLQRLLNRCGSLGTTVSVSWVTCDEDSMHEYLMRRGAARDAWKLANWDRWLSAIDLHMRPSCDHFVVDNRLNGCVTLADQAKALMDRIKS
jgi:predicted kinase